MSEQTLCQALRLKVLDFLCAEGVLDAGLARRMLKWRHSGFSVHNRVRSKANDAEARQRLARYMIRCPFALNKMSFDQNPGTVFDRSKPHATLKRNYQLMPALKWLRLLLNHVPVKYEQRLAEQEHDTSASIVIDEPAVVARRNAKWTRLIQKVYEVDPLKCLYYGATMRIIALIDVARFLRGFLYLTNIRSWP